MTAVPDPACPAATHAADPQAALEALDALPAAHPDPSRPARLEAPKPAAAGHGGVAEVVHDRTALVLPSTPQAAGRFRRHTREAAARWGLGPESRETLEVCVSELVTNAIVHGVGPDVLLVLSYTGDSVLTEVFGQAVDRPVIPRQARPDWAESGRGLFIVETLAKDWGSEPSGRSLLRVWASIAVDGAGNRAAEI